MLEFKYDTQLLIEGTDLDEDEINDYITEHFKGDCFFFFYFLLFVIVYHI